MRVRNVYDGMEKFVKGVIAKIIGSYRYLVKTGNRVRYVHTEHLRKTGELESESVSPWVPNESNDIPPEILSPDQLCDTSVPTDVPPVPTESAPDSLSPVPSRATPRRESLIHDRTPVIPRTPKGAAVAPESNPRRSTRARRPPKRLIESM